MRQLARGPAVEMDFGHLAHWDFNAEVREALHFAQRPQRLCIRPDETDPWGLTTICRGRSTAVRQWPLFGALGVLS